MLDKNLVDGFHVDECTMKSDCQACVEAKQTQEPFGNNSECKTEVGELTHMDLLGPYSIASVNGNKYYIRTKLSS